MEPKPTYTIDDELKDVSDKAFTVVINLCHDLIENIKSLRLFIASKEQAIEAMQERIDALEFEIARQRAQIVDL